MYERRGLDLRLRVVAPDHRLMFDARAINLSVLACEIEETVGCGGSRRYRSADDGAPFQLSRRGVDRVHLSVAVPDIDHAVSHHRRTGDGGVCFVFPLLPARFDRNRVDISVVRAEVYRVIGDGGRGLYAVGGGELPYHLPRIGVKAIEPAVKAADIEPAIDYGGGRCDPIVGGKLP
ncbi:hypothetical protein SDC9_164114 [bioreactor metagenome]|uniref:Uncharacterized protein n=1 Tax=bioreactor metagenome TaxID=1076179 RepID=A0A645FQP7_9ZZZZ